MRNYGGSALMLFVTMAAAVGSYTINLKVSGERAAVDGLRRQIARDARDARNLQAELRTRARFPEMQRWNDDVLQMSAPSAAQFVHSPVQLASYGAEPVAPPAAAPAVQYAVTAPVQVAAPAATIVRAAYRPAAPANADRQPVQAPAATRPALPAATLIRASYMPAFAPAPRRAAPARVASFAADIGASLDGATATVGAPRDLLPDGGH